MTRKIAETIVVLTSFVSVSVPAAVAADISSPSAKPFLTSASASPSSAMPGNSGAKQSLTPDQKAGLIQAKKNLMAALRGAKSSFSLFVADAQANRDQAILMAGTDKKARAAAQTQFRNALTLAKTTLQNSIAQANSDYASALKQLNIVVPPSK